MNVISFLASEGASFDHDDSRLSIFKIIDQIEPVSLPLSIPKIVLTMVVTRSHDEPDTIDGILSIVNNEHHIWDEKQPGPIKFDDKLTARMIIVMNGLPVTLPGTLNFTFKSQNINETFSIKILNPPTESDRKTAVADTQG